MVDGNTRMVIVDRTTAFCGFTFDMKVVCRIAHAQGALVLDDAMQMLGAVDIDIKDDDVDMLISGAYKWQCGPEGAGIFYIKRAVMDQIDARFRNYIWADIPGMIPFADRDHDNLESWVYPPVNNANQFSQDATIGPSLFGWIATLKFYEKIGIKAEAGLQILAEIGLPAIENRIVELTAAIISEAKESGYTLAVPDDPKRHGALITLRTHDENALVASLEDEGIVTSCRFGNLRIAPHFYNNHDDIDTLFRALKRRKHLLI